MEKVRDVASALIDSTVRVIARDGLDKASVRTISSDCQVPNPYIYQFFKDKDDLLISTFTREDTKLADEFSRVFSSVHSLIPDTETRCRVIWFRLWKYMMDHQESIQFYVRYYYSISFQKYAYTEHMARYKNLFEKMKTAFPDSVDVQKVLHHILDTLLGEAMKQIENPKVDNSIAGVLSFRLIFSVVKSYVKQTKPELQE